MVKLTTPNFSKLRVMIPSSSTTVPIACVRRNERSDAVCTTSNDNTCAPPPTKYAGKSKEKKEWGKEKNENDGGTETKNTREREGGRGKKEV